ncbi:MAG: 4-(cytidine 5'-diphospho)-2-C-methyl-D-erythritol kinase [Planctomycetota bacterium]
MFEPALRPRVVREMGVVRTPAKLNLFLEIVRRRADGYHDLDSLFIAVDLYDRLRLRRSSGDVDELQVSGIPIPGEGENLVLKALRAVRARRAIPPLIIELRKRIPPGSGLGGGSGNAAGMLELLDSLLRLDLERGELLDLAAQVGSDVPFFLGPSAARIRGRGDRIEAAPTALFGGDRPIFVLVVPSFGVSTASVYQRLTFPLTSPDGPLSFPSEILTAAQDWHSALFNRLEAAATSNEPRLATLRTELERASPGFWCMSGSGSAFFRPCGSVTEAKKLHSHLTALTKNSVRPPQTELCSESRSVLEAACICIVEWLG